MVEWTRITGSARLAGKKGVKSITQTTGMGMSQAILEE
jgi:hypothetical protein